MISLRKCLLILIREFLLFNVEIIISGQEVDTSVDDNCRGKLPFLAQ